MSSNSLLGRDIVCECAELRDYDFIRNFTIRSYLLSVAFSNLVYNDCTLESADDVLIFERLITTIRESKVYYTTCVKREAWLSEAQVWETD